MIPCCSHAAAICEANVWNERIGSARTTSSTTFRRTYEGKASRSETSGSPCFMNSSMPFQFSSANPRIRYPSSGLC